MEWAALLGLWALVSSWNWRRHRKLAEERALKVATLEATVEQLQNQAAHFESLSASALKSNAQSFLEMATAKFETLQSGAQGEWRRGRDEIQQVLTQFNTQVKHLEKSRTSAYASLSQHLEQLTTQQGKLQLETHGLVQALRTPHIRGRWGEIQLRRVVEIAGMLEWCDFETQTQTDNRQRPDLIVRLPNDRQIVVDAKAPLYAYLEAIEAPTEELREEKLKAHARQLKSQMQRLAAKAYWEQFPNAPDYVVLFLPGEAFFSAALQKDPSLIEWGAEKRVLLATPTTLIALLRAIASGWQEVKGAEYAQEVSKLGKELHARLHIFLDHMADLRKHLHRGVEAYNRSVATLESRVLVSARKLEEMHVATDKELPQPAEIET